MKIWRKDSTKPIKNNKPSDEEFTDIATKASTPKKEEPKKMEEIYSTKDKQVKYKRQTPLEAEEAAKRAQQAKEKLASGKAEIALDTPVEEEKIVELTSEFEEGTVIAEDIIDVGDFKKHVEIQDINEIDIDLDPTAAIKKYERQVNSTQRADERKKEKAPSAYEQIFGKPKFDISGEKIVSKIPTYQHSSKINLIHLKAGRFTDVVESEYDEYLKSNDPTISKRPESLRNIEPKQSLLYTLSQLASQKNIDKQKNNPDTKKSNVQTAVDKPQKKKKSKFRKFFRILKVLILPKKSTDPKASASHKPQQTIDYQSRQDYKFVSDEISSNLKKLIIRASLLLVIFLCSLTLTIMEKVAGAQMFANFAFTSQLYCAINLLLIVLTGVICKSFIISGLRPLRHFKGNSDTALSCAYFACLIQNIASMFVSKAFVDSQFKLYTTILTMGFMLNILGRTIMVWRVKSNFKFITAKSPAYAAKIFNDEETARKMLSGTTAAHSVVAYQHETDFLSDFLKISYAPDPSEEICGKLAPITLVSSVFVGIIYGIIYKSFIGALTALAVMCCISIPLVALLTGNVPLKLLCNNTLKSNAMLSGYPSIRQFCDSNAVMVNASDLYPKGSIKLKHIKYFAEYRVEEAMLSAITIMQKANSPLYNVFSDSLAENKNSLPKVESILYEDKLGLVGWVGGERVLIGNRNLLDRFHIYIEDAADETRYKNNGYDVTYIACSGQLIAMVVTKYHADEKVKDVLARAQKSGLCMLVSTSDSNITQDKLSADFELYYRTIKVLNTGFSNTCAQVCERKEETSRAYLATRGDFTSLVHAVTGAITYKQNLTIGLIIQIFGLILGVLLSATMVLYASVSILGIIEMLLYMLFWGVATIIAQFIKQP